MKLNFTFHPKRNWYNFSKNIQNNTAIKFIHLQEKMLLKDFVVFKINTPKKDSFEIINCFLQEIFQDCYICNDQINHYSKLADEISDPHDPNFALIIQDLSSLFSTNTKVDKNELLIMKNLLHKIEQKKVVVIYSDSNPDFLEKVRSNRFFKGYDTYELEIEGNSIVFDYWKFI